MITLTTTIVLTVSLIVWLSVQVKVARQNTAKVQALLTRAQVAAEKLKAPRNYQKEHLDFVEKLITDRQSFFDLI